MLQADGHVSDDEVRFIATHIDRQIYDENTWIDLPQNEKERWVTHLEAGNEVDCLDRVSHRLDRNSKRILYAWFFSLSAMDGELSMDEALVLNEGVEFFGDRDQVFSREALSEADIDIIKERVHALLIDSSSLEEILILLETGHQDESMTPNRLGLIGFLLRRNDRRHPAFGSLRSFEMYPIDLQRI